MKYVEKNDWKILIENLLRKKVVKIIKHMKCQKVVINICIIEKKQKKIVNLDHTHHAEDKQKKRD